MNVLATTYRVLLAVSITGVPTMPARIQDVAAGESIITDPETGVPRFTCQNCAPLLASKA